MIQLFLQIQYAKGGFMYNLKGKTAVITGGNSGVGAATAMLFAKSGANVVISVRRQAALDEVASEIKAEGGNVLTVLTDISKDEDCKNLMKATVDKFGSIDILVNNAGVLAWGSTEELTLEQLDHTLAINVRSVFVASQEASRHMTDGGRIINIGSTNAQRIPVAGGAVYAMSKSALVGLAKGMARDLGPRGITVNNVQPGPVDTEMNPADGEGAEYLKGLMALGRYGRAEEVSSFVAYLAGTEAGFITGASLTIDGGFSA